MRVLEACPNSVLWLLRDNEDAVCNLRREAQRAGVDAERLVLALRLDRDAHMTRHPLAELFLDHAPYNANATPRDDFAVAATDRLSELGFRVVSVVKAEKPQAISQVIDFNTTKKVSAIPLLQRNFGIKAKNIVDQPDAQSPIRYRIVAGTDF